MVVRHGESEGWSVPCPCKGHKADAPLKWPLWHTTSSLPKIQSLRQRQAGQSWFAWHSTYHLFVK